MVWEKGTIDPSPVIVQNDDVRHEDASGGLDVSTDMEATMRIIAKYEGGERRIDVLEFLAITRALGAEPTRLLKALIRRMT